MIFISLICHLLNPRGKTAVSADSQGGIKTNVFTGHCSYMAGFKVRVAIDIISSLAWLKLLLHVGRNAYGHGKDTLTLWNKETWNCDPLIQSIGHKISS